MPTRAFALASGRDIGRSVHVLRKPPPGDEVRWARTERFHDETCSAAAIRTLARRSSGNFNDIANAVPLISREWMTEDWLPECAAKEFIE